MKPSLYQKIEESKNKDVDLTPLIDVVFILLIFFIVTTVFVKETGVTVEKPNALSTKQLDRNIIMIAITSNEEVVHNSTNIGVHGVRPTIQQELRRKEKPVVIQADKNVKTDLLVQVIDQINLAGATQVNIATLN